MSSLPGFLFHGLTRRCASTYSEVRGSAKNFVRSRIVIILGYAVQEANIALLL